MEKYYQLLKIIQGYQHLVVQYDNTLRAYDYHSGPKSSNVHTDLIGDLLVKKEAAMYKLPKLEALAASRRSAIESTIAAAVSTAAKKEQLRTALIFKMRYNSAHSWEEIANIIGSMNARSVRNRVIQCIEKAEENDECFEDICPRKSRTVCRET